MESIVYVVAYIALMCGGFLYKKTNRVENGWVWLIVTPFLIRMYHGLVYFFFHIAGIGYHMWLLALMDILLAGIFFYKVIYTGQKQVYHFKKADALALGTLFLLWLLFVWKFYGFDWSLRFGSVDPALHAQYAKTLFISRKSMTNMYFSSLNTALWMELLEPFVMRQGLYKIFVFCNALDFLYSGLMWYAVVRRFVANKLGHVLMTVLMVLYLFAYPLYTTIFGFSYYTASIIVISCILFFYSYYKTATNSVYFTLVLNVALFNLFTSYTLFVPIVFISLFLSKVWILYQDRRLLSLKMIKDMLFLFLVPTIFGLILSISNLSELQPGAGISAEGGAYMDLFSNFVLFSGVCLLGMWHSLKNKEDDLEQLMFIVSIVLTLVMFVFSLKGYVSVYYLSKMYNLLWLLFFFFVAKQICYLAQQRPVDAVMALSPYFICFAIYVSRIDIYAVHHVPPYEKVASSAFLNVYENNYAYYVHWGKMDQTRIRFLQDVAREFADEEMSNIVSVGDEGWSKWSDFFLHGKGSYVHTGYFQDVQNQITQHTEFICVIHGGLDYDIRDNLSQIGQIIYQTEQGYVVELHR